jgi:hypothetical protein
MKSELFRIIKGEDVITPTENNLVPIVDKFMYKRDYMLLVSEEKQGKTILAQQLACSLTTGTSFLDIYDIPNPVKVCYFITEGREDDMKDRFRRISNRVGIDTDNIVLVPTFFRFNTKEGIDALWQIAEKLGSFNPEVVIVDSLYRAISGSLKDDHVINDFHFVMQKLSERFQCAILLVHHMTKPTKDQSGKYYGRNDKDSFGSAFLSAGVDHIFWIEPSRHGQKYDKVLRCDTQRSGLINEQVRIRLKRNDPLYFEIIGKNEEFEKAIRQIISKYPSGMPVQKLMDFMETKDRTKMYTALKNMIRDKVVEKEGSRPVMYKLSKESSK